MDTEVFWKGLLLGALALLFWPLLLLIWIVKQPSRALPTTAVLATVWAFGFATEALNLFALAVVSFGLAMAAWAIVHHHSYRERMHWRLTGTARKWLVYQPRWKKLMRGCRLHQAVPKKRDPTPRLRKVKVSRHANRLIVDPLPGQTVEDFRPHAAAIARRLNARRCVVRHDGQRVAMDLMIRDLLADPIAPLPIPEHPDLAAVPCGLREDGSTWTVQLDGTHTFLGAQTGAGKSSTLLALLRGIGPAIRDGWVQVWAWDPKGGMELGKIERLCKRSAADSMQEMVDQLRDLCELMEDRSRRYRLEGVDKHVASVAEPFILAVIDEAADIFTTLEVVKEDGKTKLAALARSYAERLLRKGRACGIHLFCMSQEPRKETFSFRGLIPQGIALGLKERGEVDMVLGPGAYEAGASVCTSYRKPTQTDPRDAGRGCEVVDGEAMEFRAWWIDKQAAAEMCLRFAPTATPAGKARAALEGDAPELVLTAEQEAEVEAFRRSFNGQQSDAQA